MGRADGPQKIVRTLGLSFAAVLLAGAAQAEVRISTNPTHNMSCSAHVCSPTATNAVLNAGDLAGMLAASDTKVTTGSGARDIVVKAALSWTSTSRLTLDGFRTVQIAKPVTVAGEGGLTIATNDGGKHGEFVIDEKASVQFWSLSSSLVIDGNSYTLVGNISTLAADIAANPSGFYALAKPYDASADGTYSSSPIGVLFQGIFEGLGNRFLNLSLNFTGHAELDGLFAAIGNHGAVRNIGVVKATLQAVDDNAIGLLAGSNYGRIERCWAGGLISFGVTVDAGGLVGANQGSILNSRSDVKLVASGGEEIGGLVGFSSGNIVSTYALHSVHLANGSVDGLGGLAGENAGTIENSFAADGVTAGRHAGNSHIGGLIGRNDAGAQVTSSYASGQMKGLRGSVAGGLIGFDGAAATSIAHSYWDLDKGISDPSQGAGNVANDPGIKGLTTAQFQSALPNGFDPKIWGQRPNINEGFPYLRAIPPK